MVRLRADPGSHSDEAGTEGSHLTTPRSTPAAAQLILQAQLTPSRVRPWRRGVKVGVGGQHICLETFSGQVGGNGFSEWMWGPQAGSGVSLLWRKVLEAQVSEDVFL